MKFLIEPGLFSRNDTWVGIDDKYAAGRSRDDLIKEYREQIARTQTLFSDLDDTDADSPAKKLAYEAFGTRHFSPSYLLWAVGYGFPARGLKSREIPAWDHYASRFLNNQSVRDELGRRFTAEYARRLLYPGVEEFYAHFDPRQCKKIYLSRNLSEIVNAFAQALGFDASYPEERDKSKAIKRYLQQNLKVYFVTVKGDSAEDTPKVEEINWMARVLSIQVMKKPHDHFLPGFRFATSRDQTGLVSLLHG